MVRFGRIMLLAGAFALAGGTAASAQIVQRSGNVFHVAACSTLIPAGWARCHAHIVTDNAGNHLANSFVANRVERHAKANLVPAGYGPTSLILAYNPAAYGTYPNGLGSNNSTIAIVDAYGYTNAEADLGVYRSTYGLPACTTANGCFAKYNESGIENRYPAQNTGWAEETALDLDMASAMCPNCKIILVEANSASYADLAAAVKTAAGKGAHVISNSYGGSESGSQNYNAAYDHPGIAITASTGDSGYGAGPQFPATSQYVTAVGGTSLYTASNARGWTETAWSDTGSGCSKVYPKPAWQAFITLCTMRMEADVSAVADPSTGVAVYGPVNSRSSAWQVYGGTSVAAPLIGGFYAANGGSVNFGGTPYPYSGTAYLNDVTSGTNGSCGGTYFCTAVPGYDGPTGLGTPNGTVAF